MRPSMGRLQNESKTKISDNGDHPSSSHGGGGEDARIIYLAGEVSEASISNVIAHMLGLASINNKPIQLVISTYGGSVDEMFSLYDVMKFLNCPVHTIGLGKIMSAGVLLLSSGKKGCRLVGSNARLMAHPIAGAVFGKIFEMENEVAECRRMQNLMIDLLKKETKMTKADIDKIMNLNHDFYLTPEQAVKFGIADKIIGAST